MNHTDLTPALAHMMRCSLDTARAFQQWQQGLPFIWRANTDLDMQWRLFLSGDLLVTR